MRSTSMSRNSREDNQGGPGGLRPRGTGAINQALRTKGPVKLWAMADLFAERIGNSLAV